ncbi:unnamed protein product [Porites evermanni]|uniref:Carbonic anhydrase n=1 Tax=Porites evermanni TaxID=104178 RepID=A0ABN8LQV9_9CNID|nr:unnamed protein product [Porites evermanni]
MAKTLLTFVCLIAGVSFALAQEGPANWGGVCASGRKQSPININTCAAMYDSNLDGFTLVNYDTIQAGVNFTAKNDGTTLKISFDSNVYNVSGGDLPGVYTTVQFHLHWGLNNYRGSEHTVDGMMYPAEIHFVSYNTKYPDIGESLPHSDGLAVLGVFIEVGASENQYYKKFLDQISHVMYKGNSTTFSAFNLMDLLPTNMTKYFRYPGSLTTPPCSEAVTWTVFDDTVKISQAQLDMLRSMKYNNSENIVDNYRPVQPLEGRQMKASFGEPKTMPPVTTDGVALKISNVVLLLMLLLRAAFFH